MRYTTKILPSISGNVGVITLNNPKALHALSADMLYSMEDILKEWFYPPIDSTVSAHAHASTSNKNRINALLLKGGEIPLIVNDNDTTATKTNTNTNTNASHKQRRMAFCAGGDVKQMYLAGLKEHEGCTSTTTTTKSYKVGQGYQGLDTADFFRQEYIVDYMLASLSSSNNSFSSSSTTTNIRSTGSSIPQISIWDGIVMGGGVGISIYGNYRIATENTIWSMPETNIGLFPDVGMLYWLSRKTSNKSKMSKAFATYIALTGQRLDGYDLLYTGIATHYIVSKDIPAMEELLFQKSIEVVNNNNYNYSNNNNNTQQQTLSSSIDYVAPILMSFHREPIYNEGIVSSSSPTSTTGSTSSILKKNESIIHTIFDSRSFDISMETIMERLKNNISSNSNSSSNDKEFCKSTMETLVRMSPTSLKITLEGLRRSYIENNTLEDELYMEYRLSQACVRYKTNDFYTGVQSVLIDKNKSNNNKNNKNAVPIPKWNPPTLEQVTDEMIQSYFEPIDNEWFIPLQYKR